MMYTLGNNILKLGTNILTEHTNVVPAVIYDGNTVGWWVANNLSTITKDGNNLVSNWTDNLGSGMYLAGNTGYLPLWTSDGIKFGWEKIIQDTFTSLTSQQFSDVTNLTYYIVMKVYQYQEGYNWWIEGKSSDAGGGNRPVFYTNGNAGNPDDTKYWIYNGITEMNTGIVMNTTKFIIATVIFNGVNSYLKINNTESVYAFNAGTTNTIQLFLGRYWNLLGGYVSYYYVKELIFRKIADTTDNQTAFYNYLKAEYNL